MKNYIVKSDEMEWKPKIAPQISPERKGFFKLLSAQHGLKQFEARLTRPGRARRAAAASKPSSRPGPSSRGTDA